MDDVCLVPPEHACRPHTSLPPRAVDCHAHVFGPLDRFPLADNRPYTPPELPVERYLSMLDEIGMAYGVLVQPVAHGTDSGALLHALERAPARLRGVALLTPTVSDEQLQAMHQRGVRGARFSRPPPGLAKGSVGFDVLEALAPRLAVLGWHAQIWAPCAELAPLVPRLAAFGMPLVVDHMGGIDVSRGVQDENFQALLRLLGEGRIWLKLTAYRLSSCYPNYEDVAPFHRALLAANPERLIWGSDWPHVHLTRDMPEIGHLLDLLESWTADEAARQRILADNPAALYGF